MLTSPEDAPALPLSRAGRSSALTEAMAPHAKAQGFLDSVQWSSAAAVPSVVSGAPSSGTAGAALAPSAPQELEEQLAQARAGEARWARIASDLYGRLVEKGLDSAASVLLSNAGPAAPMVVSAAASPAAPVAIAAPSAAPAVAPEAVAPVAGGAAALPISASDERKKRSRDDIKKDKKKKKGTAGPLHGGSKPRAHKIKKQKKSGSKKGR
mmetsp:Transcript_36884/g.66679  ORF Transcript_36884/g.66679 Transcript_36884/m.66679 type:complete len:211 (+) Transcript_36884:173-805(+)